MNEQDLEVFVTAADEFFWVLGNERPEIGESRIDFSGPPLLDYTGVIRVSGMARGEVYFTAASSPLRQMLDYLHENPDEDGLRRDLLGELVGTVVMNARERFGEGLKVEPPEVYGRNEIAGVSERISYVTPLRWGGGEIDMIIALDFEQQH